MTETLTRILLVEDQILIRDSLKQLLNLESDFIIVGDVGSGQHAQAFLEINEVDLILTDIEMPGMDGLQLCHWLQANKPELKLVILTTFNRAGYVKRAIEAGAQGFILKEVPFNELVNQLRQVVQGKKAFDSELLFAGMHDTNPLTPKECDTLRWAEQGMSTAAIAKKMCLSEGTVRNYLSESMSKVNASSRVEAAKIARDKGWL